MKKFLLALIVLISATDLMAQSAKDSIKIVRRVVMDGDTFYVYEFDEYIHKEFLSKEELEEYEKLVKRVKKVLPYAKLAAFRLQMMEDNLNQLKTKRAKRKYIKETEEAIKKEFMGQLKNLYVEEGKLLLKLIHRETGNTTYEILKKYRGSASTFYWGLLASYYDADIEVTYDPIKDYQIEYIIKSAKLE
ncbi:DUF4294 domain-containing protein [bacterium]|nr:DUF4294 domain-containing protein [bacterium]